MDPAACAFTVTVRGNVPPPLLVFEAPMPPALSNAMIAAYTSALAENPNVVVPTYPLPSGVPRHNVTIGLPEKLLLEPMMAHDMDPLVGVFVGVVGAEDAVSLIDTPSTVCPASTVYVPAVGTRRLDATPPPELLAFGKPAVIVGAPHVSAGHSAATPGRHRRAMRARRLTRRSPTQPPR
jgi:hypothetical protein